MCSMRHKQQGRFCQWGNLRSQGPTSGNDWKLQIAYSRPPNRIFDKNDKIEWQIYLYLTSTLFCTHFLSGYNFAISSKKNRKWFLLLFSIIPILLF